MYVLGIVAAKKESLRFPGKNSHIYKGEPLFWHSVLPLTQSGLVNDVVVSTDSEEIASFCNERNVLVHQRGVNAIDNEAPLLEVLKQVCLEHKTKVDRVITIMANCPGHTLDDVTNALNMALSQPSLREVRSFNEKGEETGLMVFHRDVIFNAPAISSYIGAINTTGYEVHYEGDLLP